MELASQCRTISSQGFALTLKTRTSFAKNCKSTSLAGSLELLRLHVLAGLYVKRDLCISAAPLPCLQHRAIRDV